LYRCLVTARLLSNHPLLLPRYTSGHSKCIHSSFSLCSKAALYQLDMWVLTSASFQPVLAGTSLSSPRSPPSIPAVTAHIHLQAALISRPFPQRFSQLPPTDWYRLYNPVSFLTPWFSLSIIIIDCHFIWTTISPTPAPDQFHSSASFRIRYIHLTYLYRSLWLYTSCITSTIHFFSLDTYSGHLKYIQSPLLPLFKSCFVVAGLWSIACCVAPAWFLRRLASSIP
jgi:hypothetical protein